MNGTVKSWGTKGYGFIESDGADYFVFQTDIIMDGFRKLYRGDKVEFEVGVNPKNGMSIAVKVRKMG